MISREEELKMLEKIEKMVYAVEGETYLKISFEGFFEMAKENIRDDSANNVKEYFKAWIKETKQNEKLGGEIRTLLEDARRKQVSIEDRDCAIQTLNQELDAQKIRYSLKERDLGLAQQAIEEIEAQNTKQQDEKQSIIESQALQIMKLKAEIYDLMNK